MPFSCPECTSEALDLVEKLADGRRKVICETCGYSWVRGTPTEPAVAKPVSYSDARAQFSATHSLTDTSRQRYEKLVATFNEQGPPRDDRAIEFRARYKDLFSKEGLARISGEELKHFANANLAANPGNMSVFNLEWNSLDSEDARRKLVETLEYLFYGPEATPLADRLTTLIEGDRGMGFKGFRESLLTKALCMVHDDSFLPITKYSSGTVGKREIAEAVFGFKFPPPDATRQSIGRLIIWSNDILVDILKPALSDMEDAARFLWWAKDQP
jgi:hypothetical protein